MYDVALKWLEVVNKESFGELGMAQIFRFGQTNGSPNGDTRHPGTRQSSGDEGPGAY
jgi:hypothetical protein